MQRLVLCNIIISLSVQNLFFVSAFMLTACSSVRLNITCDCSCYGFVTLTRILGLSLSLVTRYHLWLQSWITVFFPLSLYQWIQNAILTRILDHSCSARDSRHRIQLWRWSQITAFLPWGHMYSLLIQWWSWMVISPLVTADTNVTLTMILDRSRSAHRSGHKIQSQSSIPCAVTVAQNSIFDYGA